MSTTRSLRGVRGAVTVERDDPAAIVDATETLLREMMDRNEVGVDDVVSVLFTATPDLQSEFPAAAARRLGIGHVPLMCAQELAVEGALPRCIRVLIHLYTERDYASLRPVYLGEARALRNDLAD